MVGGALTRASLLVAALVIAAPAVAAPRPKFQVAVGMGASQDRTMPDPPPHTLMTAFFFSGGVWGDAPAGLDVRLFANAAPTARVNRIAGELVLAARPMAVALPDSNAYGARVLRTVSADVGPALERVNKGFDSARRLGLVLGAHVDLPIGPSIEKELRLRLGFRRMLARTVTVGDLSVGDSEWELFAMVGVVF